MIDVEQLARLIARELAAAPVLLTRTEAARLLRVSPSTFDAHVRPSVQPKLIGGAPRWLRSSLLAWLDTPKAGASESAPVTATIPSSSGFPMVDESSDRLASEILDRLRQRPPESTPPKPSARRSASRPPGAGARRR